MAGAKGKAKKRKRPIKPDNPVQSARFIAAAKELGLEGKGEDFDKTMTALLKPKASRGDKN